MIKQKLFFITLAFSLLFPLQKVLADDSSSTSVSIDTTATSSLIGIASSTQGSVLGLQAPPIPPIIASINSAKAQLANVTLNHELIPVYKKNSKKILRYNIGDKDIALAILDPATNNTVITIGRLNGKSMIFPDPAVNVQLTSFNGVNSQFQVNQPANGVVVALKYLISETDSGSKAAIERGLSQVVYVPSSPALDSPQVVAYGQNYLDGVIAKVATDLYGLPSHAIPGETITQAIPPAMIKSLIYAEHTDTSEVLNGNAQEALDNLNIIFATNQGDAYKYSVSNDGFASRGIAQFVKSTYESLVQRHPEAFLNPDYVAAMADHETSIKAMYLLLDDYAGDVRIKAANGFASGHVFEYAAASYNGGTTRVADAVNTFGEAWNLDHSGQINALTSQVTNDKSQVTGLKAKIKKTSDKKQKSSLQSQLATAQTQLASDSSQLNTIQSASLRSGTVNYLNKIYAVIQDLNGEQLAMN
jgi:hypothetical protein